MNLSDLLLYPPQTFQTLSSSSSSSADSSRLPSGAVVRPRSSIKALTGCVFELKNAVEKLLDDTWPRISATGTPQKHEPISTVMRCIQM